MALCTETQWHGTGVDSDFAWVSYGPVVQSVYTGEDVQTYWSGVDPVPYSTPGQAITIEQDVKVPVGQIVCGGTAKAGDSVSVNWITFGALGNQNRGAVGTFLKDLSSDQMAAAISRFINGNVDTAGSHVGNLVTLTPTSGQTEIQVGVTTYTPQP